MARSQGNSSHSYRKCFCQSCIFLCLICSYGSSGSSVSNEFGMSCDLVNTVDRPNPCIIIINL